MKTYRFRKTEKVKPNFVVFKSYSDRINKASNVIFSKPVFITAASALFVLSNYFIVSSFSQVSKADNSQNFKIYTSNSKKKTQSNINFSPNKNMIKEIKYSVYIVEKGDTLTKIAEKSNNDLADLIQNNKLTDSFRIQIGQRLKIVK